MDAVLPFLREFGFPVCLCLVLLWAIRHQNTQLVKAYTDRIGTLERIVKGLTDKVADLEADRIRRADEYGRTLKDLALRWSSTIRDHNDLTRQTLGVLRKLTDAITVRPCMLDRLDPHDVRTPRPPSADDLPADPREQTTDRMRRDAGA